LNTFNFKASMIIVFLIITIIWMVVFMIKKEHQYKRKIIVEKVLSTSLNKYSINYYIQSVGWITEFSDIVSKGNIVKVEYDEVYVRIPLWYFPFSYGNNSFTYIHSKGISIEPIIN